MLLVNMCTLDSGEVDRRSLSFDLRSLSFDLMAVWTKWL